MVTVAWLFMFVCTESIAFFMQVCFIPEFINFAVEEYTGYRMWGSRYTGDIIIIDVDKMNEERRAKRRLKRELRLREEERINEEKGIFVDEVEYLEELEASYIRKNH